MMTMKKKKNKKNNPKKSDDDDDDDDDDDNNSEADSEEELNQLLGEEEEEDPSDYDSDEFSDEPKMMIYQGSTSNHYQFLILQFKNSISKFSDGSIKF